MVLEGWLDEFKRPKFNFRALGVDHEPWESDIWFLRINSGPLSIDLGPLGVKFEPI